MKFIYNFLKNILVGFTWILGWLSVFLVPMFIYQCSSSLGHKDNLVKDKNQYNENRSSEMPTERKISEHSKDDVNTFSDDIDFEEDAALEEINGSAARLDMSIRGNILRTCLDHYIFSNPEATNKKINQLKNNSIFKDSFKDIEIEQEGLCKLFKLAESETRVVFNEIKNQKMLLNQQFVFSVFLQKIDAVGLDFTEEEVGLFSSLESCAKAESFARDYKIPTRLCREWKDMNQHPNTTQ